MNFRILLSQYPVHTYRESLVSRAFDDKYRGYG